MWAGQRQHISDGLDDTLRRTSEEVAAYASTARDASGQPFANTRDLLANVVETEVPDTNEAVVAFVDGNLRYVQAVLTLDVQPDTELIAHLEERTSAGVSAIETFRSSMSEYRYAIIPIVVGDTGDGAIVLIYERDAELAQVGSLVARFWWTALGVLALAAIVSWALIGRLLRPIKELDEAAARITEHDLSSRLPVRGDDDLAQVARTFNAMVDRLESSFTAQRQLLDDAGHELRTPITIIRGHLELMDPHDPEDADTTRALAISELDRMRRLTDDLVMLAKSEAPDFVVPESVDIAEFTQEVFDRISHYTGCNLILRNEATGIVYLDEQRIMQAMLQLAANAVKFSDESGTITVFSSNHGKSVHLGVKDTGIGIPPEQIPTLFERFIQVDGSRGGAGLGLPIVAAIAEAHGGHVEAESQLGEGSTFTLVLPHDAKEESSWPQS